MSRFLYSVRTALGNKLVLSEKDVPSLLPWVLTPNSSFLAFLCCVLIPGFSTDQKSLVRSGTVHECRCNYKEFLTASAIRFIPSESPQNETLILPNLTQPSSSDSLIKPNGDSPTLMTSETAIVEFVAKRHPGVCIQPWNYDRVDLYAVDLDRVDLNRKNSRRRVSWQEGIWTGKCLDKASVSGNKIGTHSVFAKAINFIYRFGQRSAHGRCGHGNIWTDGSKSTNPRLVSGDGILCFSSCDYEIGWAETLKF